ncbi:creatininase family protein [Streptosporangium carneum]|uniref:Creatinine amidohydrolase n=1 Tax=Streptosporangium carneum TaxID=47481 RepID=A0A9W6MAW5_9ACTN|nr:creatininase family protein [Streptosporangium carneum]GLK07165.1 hypothetical protein GCM10017600_05700 [Streptosporangium carneum]
MIKSLPTATTTEERHRNAPIAILPVGSFEQHGDHLPLSTDTIIATLICRKIADAYPVLLPPPITISCSHEHSAWPGTVSISARTLHAVITDIHDSVTRAGPPRPGGGQRPRRQLRAEQRRPGGRRRRSHDGPVPHP